MILYVNGDSHAAAGEAVVPFLSAQEDHRYFYMGQAPHPYNIKYSYGNVLGSALKAKFVCEAEEDSSNGRIIRTTKDFISRTTNDKVVVLLGWSNWERVEWQYQNNWWQITAGVAREDWPIEIKRGYHDWIKELDFNIIMNQQQAGILSSIRTDVYHFLKNF